MATLIERKNTAVSTNNDFVNVLNNRFDEEFTKENKKDVLFFANSSNVLNEVNEKDLALIDDSISKKAKVSSKFAQYRKTIIAGYLNEDGSICDDPKKQQLAKEALKLHNALLTVLINREKKAFIQEWADEQGLTVEALVESLTKTQMRAYIGQTKGCDEANKVKKAFANGLDLRVKKGLDAKLINANEAADLKLSILLNENGELDLLPREIRKVDEPIEEIDEEQEEKERVSNIDKILSDILKLNSKDRFELINKLAENSNEDRDLVINVAALATKFEDKIEDVNSAKEDLEADIRVLDLELKNGDKGNKKLSDTKRKNIEKKRDELANQLAALNATTETKH